ncbi:hypothetical protein PL75_02950 [Neisseria arctica]|uniref:Uncharacterized protein n=1 Tax=Neisseria arctica TaxID=1470200 RepID=A0A0J0YTV7_9NEIS|nr:hypothetical protein [Neisseria arctica]KLT73536.1 hypothetical protein PL75_02950 [Neisseria arctica]UOO86203.1 hypothetical protein LVJ86_08250 [Neisseria arctica]
MKKVMLTLALMAATGSVFAMGAKPAPAAPNYDGSGVCTREYDPVPYVAKDGRTLTAPNPCVAAKWKAQGI